MDYNNPDNYTRMTDEELGADLVRWANVRDHVNQRKPDRRGGALGSFNLREAAKRLGYVEPSREIERSIDKWNADLTGEPGYSSP